MASSKEQLNEVVRLTQLGSYEMAESLLRDVLAGEPDQAEAHHLLGLVFTFTGCFEESVTHLKRAVTLCPLSRTFRLHLGKTYLMLGEYEKAEKYLLEPDDGFGGPAPEAGKPLPRLPGPPSNPAGEAVSFPVENGLLRLSIFPQRYTQT